MKKSGKGSHKQSKAVAFGLQIDDHLLNREVQVLTAVASATFVSRQHPVATCEQSCPEGAQHAQTWGGVSQPQA
jgi:hypothetical protein